LPAAEPEEVVSFFLVGDTHYCAQKENMKVMDEVSATYNAALVRTPTDPEPSAGREPRG